MKYQSRVFREYFSAILFSLVVMVGLLATTSPVEAGKTKVWPERVSAEYAITFNGFSIGTFQFDAAVRPEGYRLTGQANIEALLGFIQWRGLTRSSGWVRGNAPRPAAYTFDFEGNTIRGNVKMAFNKNEVNTFSMRPLQPPRPGEHLLKQHHLKGVLDPLTAVMAMTRTASSNPCKMRLPIFDGKQRFNLQMSFKRKENIAAVAGLPNTQVGYVCGVKYMPIAGFVADNSTMAMAREKNIEVVLRHVPQAGLMMPQEIRVPTVAGTARLIATRAFIRMPAGGQVASAD